MPCSSSPGMRDDLLSFVVMPSHFHCVFRPLEGWVQTLEPDKKRTPREGIMQSIKRHSAKECNDAAASRDDSGSKNPTTIGWREVAELELASSMISSTIRVKAGLVSDAKVWPFGSARFRAALGLGLGTPLTKGLCRIGFQPVLARPCPGQVGNLTYNLHDCPGQVGNLTYMIVPVRLET